MGGMHEGAREIEGVGEAGSEVKQNITTVRTTASKQTAIHDRAYGSSPVRTYRDRMTSLHVLCQYCTCPWMTNRWPSGTSTYTLDGSLSCSASSGTTSTMCLGRPVPHQYIIDGLNVVATTTDCDHTTAH